MRFVLAMVLGAAAVTAGPRLARAASGGAPAPDRSVPPRVAGAPVAPVASTAGPKSWYGYQIMLADVAAVALGLAVDRAEPTIAVYLVAPSVLHGLHHRAGAAILSPLMRVFLPAMGAAIGSSYKSCNANGDECAMGGAIVGGSIGIFAALILDWSLAWAASAPSSTEGGSALDADRETKPGRPIGFNLTTAGLAPSSNGFNLVLGGRF